jgi:hypothetical protein
MVLSMRSVEEEGAGELEGLGVGVMCNLRVAY